MILTPVELDFKDLSIGESGSVRAEGLHASTIYGDLYQDLEPDRYRRGSLPPPLLLETGLLFETLFEEGLARRFASGKGEQIERPGEFTFHGSFEGHPVHIHYNPDLFIFNGVGLRVGEIKATWLSSRIPHEWLVSPESRLEHTEDIQAAMLNPKLDKYYCQIKMYSHMLGVRYGRLYVWFIAGDYTRPFSSQLISIDIEFTQDELDMNWAALMYQAVAKEMI